MTDFDLAAVKAYREEYADKIWPPPVTQHLDSLIREVERLRDILDGIGSPLAIDGENHMAAVKIAREVDRG